MKPGDRLPALSFQDPRDGVPVPLRAPELGSTVLFLPHDSRCPECRRYLDQLVEAEAALRDWGARVVVVVGASAEALASVPAAPRGTRVRWIADPEGDLARRLDQSGDATLLILDRFGECYHVARTRGVAHNALPGPGEVEEWLTYLGTQCPECGVPDQATHEEWGPIA